MDISNDMLPSTEQLASESVSRTVNENTGPDRSKGERIALVASYFLGFFYTLMLESSQQRIWQSAFTILFCLGVELLYRKQKASVESWIWLCSLLLVLTAIVSGRNRVWNDTSILFLHAFAIYWVLHRSGQLAAGKSSRFFLLDFLHGSVLIPFGSFFLRSRLIWADLLKAGRGKKKNGVRIGSFMAVIVAVILLLIATALLSSADQTFQFYLDSVLQRIDTSFVSQNLFRLVISLPVGAYLFGLVIGSSRSDRALVRQRGEKVDQQLEKLRQVPTNLWNVLVAAFIVLYLLFFAIQGSYLFGAFNQTLPADFSVANYARQGFFELCLIMALNFSLLWIVDRSGKVRICHRKQSRILCTILLMESIVFAITAFSKIYLYIDSYGFTPLRWQSIWLVVVLFTGCLMALVSLLANRQTSRYWLIFCGVSLAVLHLC